ncbi:MAG TPA: N-acyl-D-glutamate deacylase, partial [Caldilineaceae bacterium]|nr:N-acyl-D-glutamate deacylase [Caldilineaceae bacterium]
MHFDLLIKGGEVVNPGGQSGRLDIGIRRNRVAAIEPNIPAESAAQVVDASGQIVTPGLIDL